MAKPRPATRWDNLRPRYRARLEAAGITRDLYLSGASLSGARGHAATPERPERAEHHPERYGQYTQRRVIRNAPTVQQVYDYAITLFTDGIIQGIILRFDALKVRNNIEIADAEIRGIMYAGDLDTWRQLASEQKAFSYAIWVGTHRANPFWYH